MTQDQLDNILLLEQGKENPSYENIKNTVKLVDKIDKQKGENYAIRNNRQVSGIKEKKQMQVVEKTSRTNSRRNTLNDIEELDNSSFSYDNSKWQEHLEKNYKSTGTRTNVHPILNFLLVIYLFLFAQL